ncbi:cation transporting ATPase C-terminal domain-containing protein [Streptomyces sp. CA-132043]|uniref:cation transporting ATPase C-terminal domain-containing protein n=1 Tax=Streptomyces sp. CA-132043 TaxID=3240048 RepID=UPI003D89BE4C
MEGGDRGSPAAEAGNWYANSPEDVAAAFAVDPAVGLSAARAAESPSRDGPNALPEEKPEPGRRRCLDQYRSYMPRLAPAAAQIAAAALECRSETGTVLTTAGFDSKQMNLAMLVEFVLAVLVTQTDVFQRLLGTTPLDLRQFAWALVPAVALPALWELGKLIARRRGHVA